MVILIIVLLIVAFILFKKLFKIPKLGSMTLVTGGIKTGKSMLSVHLAIRSYKRAKFQWKIKCGFLRFMKFLRIKKFVNISYPDEPLLYSNIPLKVPYVPITEEMLRREVRPNYKSVFYICEASLVADSMTFKDDLLNEQLLLFNKLFAHETRGGKIFYDTQSVSDNHYCVRRSLSSYLYIHHMVKIPFFCVMYVRELKYDENGQNINTFQSDVEDTLKRVFVPKSVWKKYDCYCYSCLTDDLPCVNDTVVADNLKAEKIVSFKKYKTLLGGQDENRKEVK